VASPSPSSSDATSQDTASSEAVSSEAVSRDESLRRIRPVVPVDTADSKPVERFQHEVLRPILKFLNPVILDLVAHTLSKYGTGFTRMDRPEQRRRLQNLLGEDSRLKRTLLGMAMGHFTREEFATYLTHAAEIRRRMVELLTQRADDQLDAIVRRIQTREDPET
jgi:hypothetical protein